MQIAKAIVYRARQREDEPAIAMPSGVATYGMLMRLVETMVDRLTPLGLSKGGIVVVDVKNPFHHVALLIALSLMGLASASIQSRNHLLQTRVVPAAVLTDSNEFALESSTVVVLDEDWVLIDPARSVDYPALLQLQGFSQPEDIVRVMFSSGTTGFPKAVALTLAASEQRLLNGASLGGSGNYSREVRALNLMGLSTLMGFATPFMALSSGGIVAFAPDVTTAIHLIRLFRIELLTAAVFQLYQLLKVMEGKPPLTSLRAIATGGSKLPKGLLSAARNLCPVITFAYASTEAGILSAAGAPLLEQFPGTAGYLMPWVDMQAIGPDGSPLPVGTEGILRIRTGEVARYLSDTPDTTEMFEDGWFYPGDVGRLTPEGLVFVTGRSNEIINRGGIIVAPDAIEDVLLAIPGVKDAAVFPVENADGIDEIWAAIVSPNWVDATAIQHVVRTQLPDKVPDRVIQVDQLPRNEMGKIKRQELKSGLTAAKP